MKTDKPMDHQANNPLINLDSDNHIASISPVTVLRGKEAVEAFLKEYGDLPVNSLEPIYIVSKTWENRPKANMVKWLMDKSGVSLDTLASYLGCSRQYLNNKLTRDSFSFDDLLIAAYACGFTFTLTSNEVKDGKQDVYRVDLGEYFKASPDVLDRISNIKNENIIADNIRAEYQKKMAELEEEMERRQQEIERRKQEIEQLNVELRNKLIHLGGLATKKSSSSDK